MTVDDIERPDEFHSKSDEWARNPHTRLMAHGNTAPKYDGIYNQFDTPLQRRLRAEAYGTDIGQHSWTNLDELRSAAALLGLSPGMRICDLGCGPCGPLTFLCETTGCRAAGLDNSRAALDSARTRITALGLSGRVDLLDFDLNSKLPFQEGRFDAALSIDVVLHLSDRANFLKEVRRILAPGRPFLFTDAGVVTGELTDDEIRKRSINGFTALLEEGANYRCLEEAGFVLEHFEDTTASLLTVARGRLRARDRFEAELCGLEGEAEYLRQRRYLTTVIELSERRALSRCLYVARSRA